MKSLKKSLSLLLALVMAISCMSVGAMANVVTADGDDAAIAANAVASATVNNVTTYYTSLMEAINAAYDGGTVKLLTDVEINRWHQNVWATEDRDDLTYSGNRAVTGCNGLTINGNGKTLTVNSIDSGTNGNELFCGSRNLTVENLTIYAASGVNGIGLKSGLIENVTFNMKGANPAIYTSGSNGNAEGEHIEIRNCTFNTEAADSYAIYSCDPENGVDRGTIISGNTFNTKRSIALRSDMQFLNNVVNGTKGVTVSSGSTAVVRGNYFAETNTSRSINVYPGSAVIEGNVILGSIELETDKTYESAPDLSNNYWGGGAPANLPTIPVTPTYSSYYKDASNLPDDDDVGANFTLSNPENVGGETYVAQIGETKYETLAEAVEAVNVGETKTIELLSNASGAGIFVEANGNKNITVDFHGYTYTCTGPAVGSTGTESQAWHLEKGNTITLKNGTVTTSTLDDYYASQNAHGVGMIIQNYCDLTLDNMTVDGRHMYYNGTYALSNNNGTVRIKDTIITCSMYGTSPIAFDVCRYSSYPSVNVTVEGNSVINGNIEFDVGSADPKQGAYLSITGGTINGQIKPTTNGATALAADPDKVSISITGGTFEVGSAEALEGIAALVNAGTTFAGATVKLTADIDLSDTVWMPIGYSKRITAANNPTYTTLLNADPYFAGTFDGRNHTIIGLSNYNGNDFYMPIAESIDSNAYVYGLFGVAGNGAVLKDVNFTNVAIDTTKTSGLSGDSVGTLVGYTFGNVTVDDVTVNGSIKGSEGVGAIVGRIYQGRFTTDQTVSLTNCSATATVSGDGTAKSKVSGLFGYIADHGKNQLLLTMTNNTFTGSESGGTFNSQIACLNTSLFNHTGYVTISGNKHGTLDTQSATAKDGTDEIVVFEDVAATFAGKTDEQIATEVQGLDPGDAIVIEPAEGADTSKTYVAYKGNNDEIVKTALTVTTATVADETTNAIASGAATTDTATSAATAIKNALAEKASENKADSTKFDVAKVAQQLNLSGDEEVTFQMKTEVKSVDAYATSAVIDFTPYANDQNVSEYLNGTIDLEVPILPSLQNKPVKIVWAGTTTDEPRYFTAADTSDGFVTISVTHFSSATQSENTTATVTDENYLGRNGYFADAFTLNFYYMGDNNTENFTVTRGGEQIDRAYNRSGYFDSNAKAVYFVQWVSNNTKNDLGLLNNSGQDCWMISVKFYTRNLGTPVTLCVNGNSVVSQSFLDYLTAGANSNSTYKASYQSLLNGLSAAATGASAFPADTNN